MNRTALSSLIPGLLPFPLPGPVDRMIETALGFRQIGSAYDELRQTSTDRPISERLLRKFEINTRVAQQDLSRIPCTGPVLIVVNHPFGILDGAVLAAVLASVRSDVKIFANELLASIPEIRDLLIPVDTLGGRSAARRNASSIKASIDFLAAGGLLVAFPAGEVSHFQWLKRSVTDSVWNPAIAAILRMAHRRGASVSVVPAFVDGSNSAVFQAAGFLHPCLRTLLLGRELLNKRGRTVELRIGSPISSEKIFALPTDEERIEYLRWRTYLLASRNAYKPRTALPMHKHGIAGVQPVIDPVPAESMALEVAALAPGGRLAGSAELSVYVAKAGEVPTTLREIGRLREIAFRAAGEGTGQAVDLDEFDAQYLHLFIWNEKKSEVVGAYRLAGTDEVRQMYTATLFQYGPEFLDRMGPALELGRSFVRVEYQRAFQPLLLLWKGIGAYVARNRRYRVLFGPVSISNEYQALSRRLIVSFLERHALLREWMGLIGTRKPFRHSPEPNTGLDLDDLSALVSDLEPSQPGIPVLLRQYLKLGGKLLGFNVDPQFANVLDGLILVDLTKTEPKLLERYLGKPEAAQFLAFQKGRCDAK